MNAADATPMPPVAIVGIGCLFPRAADVDGYWANILNRVDAIGEIPASHWRPEDYFHADARTPDMTYARRGGFLTPVDFPPLDFGITPNALEATDSTQLLGLWVARKALEDAGYGGGRSFDRSRVSVILGVTGTLPLVIPLGARLGHPLWRKALQEAGVPDAVVDDVVQRIADGYVGWQEDSFPGLLGNVVAGRIANRLDLGGTNCVVDAACASSLSALHLALCELGAGRADMVLTGGMDCFNEIFMYMCFSKTPALSPTGNAKPFDAQGDGTILGEGLGCLVLKRLADAEQAGDKIYAVIRGVGTSSDGKGQAIYAPSPAGQVRCLRHAYAQAGVTPDTIELVEAHGTGTKAGDTAEVTALNEVYRTAGKSESWCALGSVKSQIGHTKAAAGAAGLIKAALALHYKVLPPTLKVTEPIEPLQPGRGPFYVNTDKRPWLPPAGHPRRAAVSSFGFGGSNFHCVLEEYRPARTDIPWDGATQLVAFSAESRAQLEATLAAWPAVTTWDELRIAAARSRSAFRRNDRYRLVVVLDRERTDLARPLAQAAELLRKQGDKPAWATPDGSYFGSGKQQGKLALLFPGQGSQYVGMLRDLACQFPALLDTLAEANAVFAETMPGGRRLSDYIYPQPAFAAEQKARDDEALRATNVAQPALGAVNAGALRVLTHFGVRGEAAAGHSFGELVALHAAGRLDARSLHRLACRRGQLMAAGRGERGSMLAVQASVAAAEQVLREEGIKLVVANKNAPKQTVLSGATAEIERAAAAFGRRTIAARQLPVAAAFHSPLVANAREQFAAVLREVAFAPAELPVYSNTTAALYPADPQQARSLLAGQLAEPVAFVDEIDALYRDGVRTFVEVGASNKLTGLVTAILEGREHAAVALDASSGQRSGIHDLARTLGQLAALGHQVDLDRWDEPGKALAERPAKKPTLTVPISGANYVRPKPPRSAAPAAAQPIRRAGGVSPTSKDSNPPSKESSPSNDISPPKNDVALKVAPVAASVSTVSREVNAHRSPVPDPRPLPPMKPEAASVPAPAAVLPSTPTVEHSLLGHALRTTQDNLQALQRLGEQTARLHGQFLENQNRALQAFQALMQQQQQLMHTGLVGTPANVLPAAPRPSPVAVAIAEPPSPAPSIPAPSAPRSETPVPPPAAPVPRAEQPVARVEPLPVPTPAAAPVVADTRSTDVLLGIVAEKTGYPAEMLGLDMELDADLGIDSIKRVEIFSALQEKLPDAPAIKPEHLGSLRTLRNVVEFIGGPAAAAPSPALPAPAAVPAPAPVAAHPDLAPVLLAVVAEKTGYPAEMLGLDMELDSDLGIDSIKRVEIFSTLQEKLPDAPAIKPEHLGSLRTLRNVVEFLGGGVTAPESPAAAQPAVPAMTKSAAPATAAPRATAFPATTAVKRYALELQPLGANREAIRVGAGDIWITADDVGVAQAIAARLSILGHRPQVVALDVCETLARPAGLAGLIILAPVRLTDAAYLRKAFRLVQFAGPALRHAGTAGSAVLATVARLDGAFGLKKLDGDASVTAGGLAGLVKTARHEWPDVQCKALDLAADLAADEAALAVVDELFLAGPPEVGIRAEGRFGLHVHDRPLPESLPTAPLGRGDVVVISGGARGVTAEVAVALARSLGVSLLLLGRSPEPQPEPDWLAPLHDEGSIKKALAGRAGAGATPREIGEQCQSWIANREMLRTLERIRATGATAWYRSVDIRDSGAVGRVLDEVRTQAGPIRGLVHGAGVLADRKIEDKTLEQFDRVYSTKVAGLQALLAGVDRRDLKLIALFSSSTARFGRMGQADYAMANEVLNKTARQLATQLPQCRVVSINWGPWDGGMVTPALKNVFQSEGVGVIPLADGAHFFLREIVGSEGAIEVVALAAGALPELAPVPVPTAGLTLAFERELNLERFRVLRAHVLAHRAVVPTVLTLEWLAHGALHTNPGLAFHGFDELRILKGIRLAEGQAHRVRVLVGKATKQDAHYRVPAELHGTGADGKDVLHARATIVLTPRLPQDGPVAPDLALDPYHRDRTSIYRDLLFHGPELQGLVQVDGMSDEGATALTNAAPTPGAWIQQPLRSGWLTDPQALDSAFQLMILWCHERHGAFSLPSFAGEYRQFRRSFPKDVRLVAQVKEQHAHRAVADLWFVDGRGATIAVMKDYECVIDASLSQAFRKNQLIPEALPSA